MIREELLQELARRGLLKMQFAQADLDGDLPDTGRAQKNTVIDVFNQQTRCDAQAAVASNKP